jgi:hypothetical protein
MFKLAEGDVHSMADARTGHLVAIGADVITPGDGDTTAGCCLFRDKIVSGS